MAQSGMLARIAFLSIFLSAFSTAAGNEPGSDVDLLLCLAADASHSVSEIEYALQRNGHANAIIDPEVIGAIMEGERGRIAVTYIEWARPDQQFLAADWEIVDGPESASAFSMKIRTAAVPPWIDFNVRDTSTGEAIRYCLKRFDASPYKARRKVIDISSDGTSNSGVDIIRARDRAVGLGVTINVLAISRSLEAAHYTSHTRPEGGLVNYFVANVAGGYGSFVHSATDYRSFSAMMRRKFLLEIASKI